MPIRRTLIALGLGSCLLSSCGYSTAPALLPPASRVTPAVTSPVSSAPAHRTTAVPTMHPSPTPTPRTLTPTTSATVTAAPGPTTTYPSGSGPLIVLNPGHNGGNATHAAEINRQVPAGFGEMKACDTTGTNTDAGYGEHAFNWDVALRVRTILQAHGVRVLLTRPTDTGVGPCVNERAAVQNSRGVVASITIHADGAPTAGHGFHVNEDSQTPEGASAASVAGSRRLGTALHDALQAGSGLVPSTYIGTNGYVYRNDFAGLNMVSQPSSFLELGNMRNPGDAALQTSAAGRQRIATAIATGILHYLDGP